MKTVTIKSLKSAHTLSDLSNLGIGRVKYDIGYRGGHVAFYSSSISIAFRVPEDQLPGMIGVYSNYLGGGVRGALGSSDISRVVDRRKARKITELIEACRRAYINAEEDTLCDDEWNVLATDAARSAGIVSAY